jgi:hypothetical protein
VLIPSSIWIALLFLVLTWEAKEDWRNPSRLSPALALAPLGIGFMYGCLSGRVWISLAVSLLTFFLMGLELSKPWIPAVLAAAGVSVLFYFGHAILAISLGILFTSLRLNILGEADGMALMGCLLMFPDVAMAACLLLGLAIASAASLAYRYRIGVLKSLRTAISRLLRHQMPTSQELSEQGSPMIWGVLLGYGIFAIRFIFFATASH